MKKNRELISWLLKHNVFKSGDNFLSKSGKTFDYETDIREAYKTYDGYFKTSQHIFNALDVDFSKFNYFLGVPETGSMIAFGLNHLKFERTGSDFDFNMLRSVRKEYQESTNSVYTVLPLNNTSKVCIVEDDVVTGKTLFNCLDKVLALGVPIEKVISVIDRELKDSNGKTIKAKIEQEYGLAYQALVTLDDIFRYKEEIDYCHDNRE